MSTITLIACIAVATALTTPTFAVTPASRDVGSLNFEWVAEDFSGWHMALFGGRSTRNVEAKGLEQEIEIDRYNIILGYDLTRWLTVYGVAGVSKAQMDTTAMEDENTGVFGAGVWANLIQVDQLSYLSSITEYRLASGAEATYAGFDDFSWMQFDAFLTLELVNEMNRASFIFPEAVSIFAGPIISYVESDDLDHDSDNVLGLTVGASVMFTDDTYATVGADIFSDDEAIYGMAGVRF